LGVGLHVMMEAKDGEPAFAVAHLSHPLQEDKRCQRFRLMCGTTAGVYGSEGTDEPRAFVLKQAKCRSNAPLRWLPMACRRHWQAGHSSILHHVTSLIFVPAIGVTYELPVAKRAFAAWSRTRS
jgi:hypothetical protein